MCSGMSFDITCEASSVTEAYRDAAPRVLIGGAVTQTCQKPSSQEEHKCPAKPHCLCKQFKHRESPLVSRGGNLIEI